ncbi:hypothetical protein IFO70_17580 [Phormidium tenue FACHB-886]|nr:hypothetical protein [Phormidium tenue FACHB-886]
MPAPRQASKSGVIYSGSKRRYVTIELTVNPIPLQINQIAEVLPKMGKADRQRSVVVAQA